METTFHDKSKVFSFDENTKEYSFPNYELGNEGIQLNGESAKYHFIDVQTNETTEFDFVAGITVQDLLNCIIEDFKFKQTEVASRETAIAITNLEEAQMWFKKGTLYYLEPQLTRIVSGAIYEIPCRKRAFHDPTLTAIIRYIRGVKDKPELPRQAGNLNEQFLGGILHYLESLKKNREISLTITKIEQALMWLNKRQIDRVQRQVINTTQQ